jgi:hypothetical protein
VASTPRSLFKTFPLTAMGAFTIQSLILNRFPLVAHRLRKQQHTQEIRLLTRYKATIELLDKMHNQQSELMEEQKQLLREDKKWLLFLINKKVI